MNDDNIPPVARGVLCVDFDGTLFPWGALNNVVAPFPGAVKAMKSFKEAGYKIVILTSRLSPTWWRSAGFTEAECEAQYQFVFKRLTDCEIPFDRITSEKVPATAYIDDKAVEFVASKTAWTEIGRRVLG